MTRRKRMLEGLDQDIREHIAMETQDNIERGMPPEEARYAAVRKFGNVTRVKEDTRDVWSFIWLEQLWQDLRYGLRMLRKSPGFTAVAVLTLALGIGANVAAFTVVHSALLNPLPFPNPEQLVRVYGDLCGSNSRDIGLSAPELWDLRDRSDIFEDISALASVDVNFTGGDRPERIQLQVTSSNYFTMLGAIPEVGRVYTKNDDQPGFTEGVVLSDGFWRRTFGGDLNAIGRKIRLDSDLYIIIGIMPPEFRHPGRSLTSEVDVWASAGFNAHPFPVPVQRSQRVLPGAMGRLKPGLTIAQAQARLNAFSAQLSQQYPADYPAAAQWTLRLASVHEHLVGNMRTELLVLFGAVAFVLLIACVNLANLLLARAAARQPALQTANTNQVASLREGSRGSGSSRRQTKISRVLVASEIALSLVLLIGAGLLLRSFWHCFRYARVSNRTGS